MNRNGSKQTMFASSSVIMLVLLLVVMAVNAVVASVFKNPFYRMSDVDMNNLPRSPISQTDLPAADTALAQNTDAAAVSPSDGKLLYPDYPYYIEVDKTNQVVTVYTTSASGKYDKVVRQMLCSTAENKKKFPDGYWKLKADRSTSKTIWRTMQSHGKPLYAQYATQITGHFLFHSVPYTDTKNNALDTKRFGKLGVADSGGCIRLTVENAKWICENCVAGTTVRMMTKEANPQLTEALKANLPALDGSGWDPTDPNPKNPNYHPQYLNEPVPETEGYLVDNRQMDKIKYSSEIWNPSQYI